MVQTRNEPPIEQSAKQAEIQAKRKEKIIISFVLCFCSIIGLTLNLWGINFGLPFFMHPDESIYLPRALTILYSSDLNPYYFYNPPLLTYMYSLVMSLYFVCGKLLGWFASMTDFQELYLSNITSFFVIARTINAVLGVGICLLVYQIGKKLFDKVSGLIASIFVCSSFLIVKDSHYAVNDISGTFFLILSFSYIVGIYTKGRLKDYVLSGLFAGMAVATKYNMGIVLFPLVLAHLLSRKERIVNKKFMWAVLSCLGGFVLFCPWIFLDYKAFWTDFANQSSMSMNTGLGGSTSFSYMEYIFTLIWGYGFLPLCFFIIGSIHLWRGKRARKLLLIFCFPLSYFLLLGGIKLFYVRFAIPLIPYLCLLSACGIIAVVHRISYPHRVIVLVLVTLVSVSQGIIFSCKHNHLISKPDTRVLARDWISNNLPYGSKIVTEGYSPDLKVYCDRDRLKENINNYQVENVWTDLPLMELNDYKEQGFEYVITSSYIRDRYLDSPSEYNFYITLEEKAEQVFYISPAHGKLPFYMDEVYSPFWNIFILDSPGPKIKIYKID